jgi:hypothetical protein
MTDVKLSRILLGGMLLALPALSGCAADWWTVDQSAYQPPTQSADEVGQFARQAPTGASEGGADQQAAGAGGAGEEAGDPAFQPHPAR